MLGFNKQQSMRRPNHPPGELYIPLYGAESAVAQQQNPRFTPFYFY
jgi:hypothetical protein